MRNFFKEFWLDDSPRRYERMSNNLSIRLFPIGRFNKLSTLIFFFFFFDMSTQERVRDSN